LVDSTEMMTTSDAAAPSLSSFEGLLALLDTVPDAADVDLALDAATRSVVDAILARDSELLADIAVNLRSIQGRWPDSDDGEAGPRRGFDRLAQLLASVVAALQRLPSSEDHRAVADGTHAYRMLACVAQHGEIANARLRDELGLPQDEASRTGRVLAERGLVVKTQVGRVVWWAVTDRGRRVLRRTMPSRAMLDSHQEASAVAPVSQRELRTASTRVTMPEMQSFERMIAARQGSLQSISRFVTAIALRQGVAHEISRRLLLWNEVRSITDHASEKFEFRYPSIDQGIERHRMLLWDSLEEVAPAASVREFRQTHWPLPAPAYDALVMVNGANGPRGLVFVDARVSPEEFKESPIHVRAEAKKRALRKVLLRTRQEFGVTSTHSWRRFPDASTRIAFFHTIQQSLDVPIWQLNLYFVASGSGGLLDGLAPRSEDEWFPVIERIRNDFALDANDVGQRMRREFILEPFAASSQSAEGDETEVVTVEVPPGVPRAAS
jgi:DNA-binding MarR family transcriptional regulator